MSEDIRNDKNEIVTPTNDKFAIPYYKIALDVLTQKMGLSTEDAKIVINTSSFEDIESEVNAKPTIDTAIPYIAAFLSNNNNGTSQPNPKKFIETIEDELSDFIYGDGAYETNPPTLSFNTEWGFIPVVTLLYVHDMWVKNHPEMFNAREKKYQHLPGELIGWNELSTDLIFLKPIFESLGGKVDEEYLHELYNQLVATFFIQKNIHSTEDLVNLISKGEAFYPTLTGYSEDDLSKIHDPEFVRSVIIPQIANKGIGTVEKVREKIVAPEIAKDPKLETVSQPSSKEQEGVAKIIANENIALEAQKNNDDIVNTIMKLAQNRAELINEIKEMKKNQPGRLD